MSYEVGLLSFGILLMLLGLIGKIKAKELEVGTSSVIVRLVTLIIGLFLIVLSFNPEIAKKTLSNLVDPTLETAGEETEQIPQNEDNRKAEEQARKAAVVPLTKQTVTEPAIDMEMVKVPSGCFQMGSKNGESNEKPVHKVCITKDYYLGKFEVTQGQWKKIMDSNPSDFKKGDNHPVEQVSWNDVQTFISKLNAKTGKIYRLPTEAEWEYACRSGGKEQTYCGGNNLSTYGWYGEDWNTGHHAVGGKSPNGLGLYDMSGNVWEWVQDWYGKSYYQSSPTKDPAGSSSGSVWVFRGGSWFFDASGLRGANRGYVVPGGQRGDLGVRLARSF